MRPEVVKLTLDSSRDPTAPRALITSRSGGLLGFWDVTEPWIASCFEGTTVAYFEAWVSDEVELICAANDPSWI